MNHISLNSHLKEELNHMMPEEDFNMENEEEMEFHYFKVHDHDNDNRLDGLELGMYMYVLECTCSTLCVFQWCTIMGVVIISVYILF